ncbi:endoribonuclease Dicer homolog 4-like isoform X3 [Magnolia sinica]|nr:endoribonuclease Dicer homolog 4-like isoform X3 [Magnolia sinica]
MTPQILLRNLEHCFIRMEIIALLIFDECHHAQIQNRHPYAQIMKEFYKTNNTKRPRIFGMTASPVIGKGGSNQANYSKSINSLENLLDAKVCSVEDKEELESLVASPHVKFYCYGSTASSCILKCIKKLEDTKFQCMAMFRKNIDDHKDLQKKKKLLWRLHENLIFCLVNLGLWGGTQAVRILKKDDQFGLREMMETEGISNDNLTDLYLTQAAKVLDSDFMNGLEFGGEISTRSGDGPELEDGIGCNSFHFEALEEPFFSEKLLVLIRILSTYRSRAGMKCIVFVKRIIVARSLAFILGRLPSLTFWKCQFLVGMHSGQKNMSRKMMNGIVEDFRSGKVNLLVATNVAEEGLDIQTCCLVIRFDLPESVTSYIQSRGRARMQQSEYVFLVDRGKELEMNKINDFISEEDLMNKEIVCRSSSETFDGLEERRYKVETTGASISTGSSVSLLYHYCSKLPRDEYFTPRPEFYYIDDLNGTLCRIVLPPNAPLRQVDSLPCLSKDEAQRTACLKACIELHALGALTDFLLPGQDDENNEGQVLQPSESDDSEDEILREELHEMLVPAALRVPWSITENPVCLHFYFIQFIPIPDDRQYQNFGLFIKTPLPKEAETMDIDLHLKHGRIVNTTLLPSGLIEFDNNEIIQAQNFQEMFLKIILDREEFLSDFVPLGKNASPELSLSTFYLLLPVRKHEHDDKMTLDWEIVKGCLSSPVFRYPTDVTDRSAFPVRNSLEFISGPVSVADIPNSLVLTPHNELMFFVVDILHGVNANSQFKDATYLEHYMKRFNIHLSYPEQPLLKAKQLFSLSNLLHNGLQANTEVREKQEHFVELPPELCSLKIIGFSKDIGSSLSLLPSIMHRLENLLVAIELKNMLSTSFPEGSKITANHVLEALTTEKCLERFSLERLEVLGDAFLKYAVSRHLFLLHEGLDEGQLTRKRSSIVNNSHLYELAKKNNLQVYIRDEWFYPSNFYALGRPCKVICNQDTEKDIHAQIGSGKIANGAGASVVKCNKRHHWLHRKTIADVVEALVGAFIVDSGFKAATAFLRWMGIQVDFEESDVSKACIASKSNLSLTGNIDIASLERLIGYKFLHSGLLLQAFIHPSYNKHSGGCYQRLEFLGDAVVDYLMTSYLYSVYPDLKPGQLTDLRSMAVNNNSFAHIAVCQSFHSYLISDSSSLSEAIKKFVNFIKLPASEKNLHLEPKCPKVLGDLVESCAGAVLLDTGFDLKLVWRIMFNFLDPAPHLQLSPIRELQELCQSFNFELTFPWLKKDRGTFSVEAVVNVNGVRSTGHAINLSRKVAKRMAAEEVLSKLKARGFKPKSKPLEDILKLSRKKEPQLIGYDEAPLKMDAVDTIRLEELQIQDAEEALPSTDSNRSKAPGKEPAIAMKSAERHLGETQDAKVASSSTERNSVTRGKAVGPTIAMKSAERHAGETSEAHNFDTEKETAESTHKRSARSCLYEICAANYWSPPSFECCQDEGPSHMKMFVYKVTVEVEDATTTILECFGEPRSKKKSAAEHAAEGALWFLQHQGYYSKSE